MVLIQFRAAGSGNLLLIEATTFAHNTATTQPSSAGGGLTQINGVSEITNATFSGNEARRGGGIHIDGGSLKTIHVTLFENISTASTGGGSQIYSDVLHSPNTSIVLENTLIGGAGNNCNGSFASMNFLHTYDDFGTCWSGVVRPIWTINQSWNLNLLAYNNGNLFSETHEVPLSSPANNLLPALFCTTPVDQNGTSRTGFCDLGAFEN